MHRQQGFTLIELLVVIAIIGILATLVITQLSRATVKARISGAQSDVTEAGKAVQLFANDENSSGAVIATAAGASTMTFTGNLLSGTNYFSGTQIVDLTVAGTTSRYGTSISKSPSQNYVYKYKGGVAADLEGAKTASLTPVYSFCTNVKAVAGAAVDSTFQATQSGTAANPALTCP